MRKLIIGFSGKKGAGKDYAAQILMQEAHKGEKTTEQLAFADPMRSMLHAIGLSPVELSDRELKEEVHPDFGCSPRHMLQTLGTEWGRNMINTNIWLNLMSKSIEESAADVVLITDVRFDDEATLIRQMGGYIMEVRNNTLSQSDTHSSEAGITLTHHDLIIPNNMDHNFAQLVVGAYRYFIPHEYRTKHRLSGVPNDGVPVHRNS